MKNRERLMYFVAVVAFASTTVNCSTYSVIRTDPPGAHLYLNNQYMGRTPVRVKLHDGLMDESKYVAKLKMDGYEDQVVILTKHWSAGYLVMDILLLLPTLGLSTYFIFLNGQVHDSKYNFRMEPKRMRQPPPPPPSRPTAVPAPPTVL